MIDLLAKFFHRHIRHLNCNEVTSNASIYNELQYNNIQWQSVASILGRGRGRPGRSPPPPSQKNTGRECLFGRRTECRTGGMPNAFSGGMPTGRNAEGRNADRYCPISGGMPKMTEQKRSKAGKCRTLMTDQATAQVYKLRHIVRPQVMSKVTCMI